MSASTGPCRVANDGTDRVYAVQYLLTGEPGEIQTARMRFYADYQQKITLDVVMVFQQLKTHGAYHIRSISTTRWATYSDESVVKVV